MAESQFLSVIRVWAAMAWADGTLAPTEASALERLIEGAGLAADERAVAASFLTTRVDLDTSNLADLLPDARKGIYRAACRLATAANQVAGAERQFLERLRNGLGIPADVAAEVEGATLQV